MQTALTVQKPGRTNVQTTHQTCDSLFLTPSQPPSGFKLPRKIWASLNKIQTNHGECEAVLFSWKMRVHPHCVCSAEVQAVNRIVFECQLRCF